MHITTIKEHHTKCECDITRYWWPIYAKKLSMHHWVLRLWWWWCSDHDDGISPFTQCVQTVNSYHWMKFESTRYIGIQKKRVSLNINQNKAQTVNAGHWMKQKIENKFRKHFKKKMLLTNSSSTSVFEVHSLTNSFLFYLFLKSQNTFTQNSFLFCFWKPTIHSLKSISSTTYVSEYSHCIHSKFFHLPFLFLKTHCIFTHKFNPFVLVFKNPLYIYENSFSRLLLFF